MEQNRENVANGSVNMAGCSMATGGNLWDRVLSRRVAEMKRVEKVVDALPMPGETMPAGMSVVECSNLRHDASGRYLQAVGKPKRHARLASLPILTWTQGEEGRVGMIKSGARLRLEYIDSDVAGYDMGGIAGEVESAVAVDAGRIVVMTDVDKYDVVRGADGKWSVRQRALYPVLRFEAVDVMRLSAEAEERELSGSYDTRSTTLTDADTDRLGADLMRSYCDLVDKAVRGGMELQPVLARYRVEGADGEVLYRSPVTLVGAPTGVQCMEELSCNLSADYRRRGALRVSAEVYKLRLRQVGSASADARRAARLVVETSLPLHPVDSKAVAANVLRQSGTNGVELRCFLPGASVTMVAARANMASQMRAMVLKGDAVFREAAVVYNPFGGAAVDVEVRVPRAGISGVDGEQKRVAAQMAQVVKPVDGVVARSMAPNRFTAASGCRVGDMVVWGGVTLRGYCGYRVEEFTKATTATGDGLGWRSVVVTELASGVKRVATSWGSGEAPLRLSPVLSSPRADAVKLTVVVERSGVVYKGTFPLTANESMTAAYYVDADCADIELEAVDEAFAYVDDEAEAEEHASLLLVARRANPVEGIAAAAAGRGRVVETIAVDRRGSTWEFDRQRLYAISDGGVYVLNVGGAATALRCDRVDRRGVAGREAVAETDDDKYPVVAVASGDLIGLSRGNVATIEAGVGATAIGWDRVHKELWLADEAGNAVVMVQLGGARRSVAGLSVTAMSDGGRGLLISSDLGVRDTSLGEMAMVEVSYRLRCDMPATGWYRDDSRLSRLGVELRSANMNGVVRVASRTIAASDVGREIAVAVRGEVNGPIDVGMAWMRDAVVEVSVSGEMTSGSELRAIVMDIVRRGQR